MRNLLYPFCCFCFFFPVNYVLLLSIYLWDDKSLQLLKAAVITVIHIVTISTKRQPISCISEHAAWIAILWKAPSWNKGCHTQQRSFHLLSRPDEHRESLWHYLLSCIHSVAKSSFFKGARSSSEARICCAKPVVTVCVLNNCGMYRLASEAMLRVLFLLKSQVATMVVQWLKPVPGEK